MDIAVCDDQKEYRELLHQKIVKHGFENDYEANVREYESGSRLLEAIRQGEHFDVCFLDIQMGREGDEGISAARELRQMGGTGLIVYVTAFAGYMQVGYEVRAFRYLLKSQLDEMLPSVLRDIREELCSGQYFTFQYDRESFRVPEREILYLESSRRVILLHTLQAEYRFYGNLGQLEQELGRGSHCLFLRCHKSFLVNVRYLRRLAGAELELMDGSRIPVSRACMDRVKEAMLLKEVSE